MPAKLTQWDLDNFERLFTAGPETDHFSAHLIRLIRKADYDNRQILGEVYPEHVEANRLFDNSSSSSRIWKCPECGAINVRKSGEQHPGRCVGCHDYSEPALPPKPQTLQSQMPQSLNPPSSPLWLPGSQLCQHELHWTSAGECDCKKCGRHGVMNPSGMIEWIERPEDSRT